MDDLEPVHGTYDWDTAFLQNPDEPSYHVTRRQRRQVHSGQVPRAPRQSGRLPVRHDSIAVIAVFLVLKAASCGVMPSCCVICHASRRQAMGYVAEAIADLSAGRLTEFAGDLVSA